MYSDHWLAAKPGDIITPKIGITDPTGLMHPPQPIKIIREATYEEWVADIEATRGYPLTEREKHFDTAEPVKFYEVSMD